MKTLTRKSYKKIFTPQGELGKVQKKPNLDFLMNIFKIPRVFKVSGFGNWNVGQHTLCTGFIVLYWSTFRGYDAPRRDQLVALAITHDLHEAVTGDILPFFKTEEVKKMIANIQQDILSHFDIKVSKKLKNELKLLDMISFLYEIRASPPDSIKEEKITLLKKMASRQRQEIFSFAKKAGFGKKLVEGFLRSLVL